MKKFLLLTTICFILFGAHKAYALCEDVEQQEKYTVTDVKSVSLLKPFDIVSVIDNPELYPNDLELYGVFEPGIASYRYKDSTVMFVDYEGELQYAGSYYGDHDGSISMCNMSMAAMEYAEHYMKEHFNHYGFVTYYDFDGQVCTAVDETGEKFIIQF